jgi:tRNA pseudouridine38-40 synthase
MPARLKLIVAYDGTGFAGWQSQLHQNTVQDHLERAFRRVTGKRLHVSGAGRTDAGAHALAQCGHVDLPDRRLSAARWTTALNGLLPPTIRVLRAGYVSQTFHARFSAKGKIYRYRIWSGTVLPPLELNRAWHVAAPIDFTVVKKAAGCFVGGHDFAAFAANRGKSEENTVRTIHSVGVHRRGASIAIEFDGDGFLYKMARLMVGAIVQCGLGKLGVDQIKAELKSGRNRGPRLAAPARGLFLVKVRY